MDILEFKEVISENWIDQLLDYLSDLDRQIRDGIPVSLEDLPFVFILASRSLNKQKVFAHWLNTLLAQDNPDWSAAIIALPAPSGPVIPEFDPSGRLSAEMRASFIGEEWIREKVAVDPEEWKLLTVREQAEKHAFLKALYFLYTEPPLATQILRDIGLLPTITLAFDGMGEFVDDQGVSHTLTKEVSSDEKQDLLQLLIKSSSILVNLSACCIGLMPSDYLKASSLPNYCSNKLYRSSLEQYSRNSEGFYQKSWQIKLDVDLTKVDITKLQPSQTDGSGLLLNFLDPAIFQTIVKATWTDTGFDLSEPELQAILAGVPPDLDFWKTVKEITYQRILNSTDDQSTEVKQLINYVRKQVALNYTVLSSISK